MSFNLDECAIPTVWCGEGNPPPRKPEAQTYYRKTGTRYECMKKGFGAGMYTEKNKGLPPDSLQQIKYVGDIYENKLKAMGINNCTQLRNKLNNKPTSYIKKTLTKIFTRRNKILDKRAYNSTLVYLYQHGNGSVPRCSKI